MNRGRLLTGLGAALAAVLATLVIAALPAAPPPTPPDRPRLAVLVVFDQMRADYLTRFRGLFGEGGFRRLFRDGAWFQNCHYPYSVTVTGAGHATLGTGCCPDTHGIIANDWFDRAAGESVYCATTARASQVPPPPAPTDFMGALTQTRTGSSSGAPDRELAETFGEALKQATGRKAKVVSLSFKDRAAVLMAGRGTDGTFWLDTETGGFVTSTAYAGRLPDWVDDANRDRLTDQFFYQPWTRFRPDVDYSRFCVVPERSKATGVRQGAYFPHAMTGGRDRPGRESYLALYNSPFGNEVILALAKKAIVAERLGRHATPDLLCVSFSCNDPIGHCWGPDSEEVMDVTLRSDAIVREFLDTLDREVGVGKYGLVLSADHGVCPVPEVARRQGYAAGRVPVDRLVKQAEDHLQRAFGTAGDRAARWVEAFAPPWIYLNQRLIASHGLAPRAVEAELGRWLVTQPGVQAALTRSQIAANAFPDDPYARAIRRSFFAARSGEVYVLLQPYWLFGTGLDYGTSHGTPYSYDTHVPLLVYGPQVRPGIRTGPVTPLVAAPTLARMLGVRPPAKAEAAVPPGLIGDGADAVILQAILPGRDEPAVFDTTLGPVLPDQGLRRRDPTSFVATFLKPPPPRR